MNVKLSEKPTTVPEALVWEYQSPPSAVCGAPGCVSIITQQRLVGLRAPGVLLGASPGNVHKSESTPLKAIPSLEKEQKNERDR